MYRPEKLALLAAGDVVDALVEGADTRSCGLVMTYCLSSFGLCEAGFGSDIAVLVPAGGRPEAGVNLP